MSSKLPGRVVREVLRRQLEPLGELPGVRGAILFSPDGFEIASYAMDPEASARLSAIGSSLAALGSAISAEAGLEDFDRTLIEGKAGTVMISRVKGDAGLVLAVIAGKDAVLGRLLWASNHCCEEAEKVLRVDAERGLGQPVS